MITADGKSRVLTDGNNGGTSGAVVLKRLEITGGDGTGRSFEVENEGGGIAVEQNGDLTLDEVLVTGNTAASSGGGIQDNGELDVEASTIADNEVTGGLGVGGGVASYATGGSNQSVTIVNSTIVGNSITGGSAKQGGGIFDGTTLALENATVAGNITATGGGGGLASSEGGGVGAGTLANDILAYNTGGDCAGRAPTSLGGNLADDSSCALKATDDKQSTNPQLVKEGAVPKLAENGSSTPTVETQSPSPAIEAGLPSHCQKRDQRGYLRKTPCSPGAFELFATFAQEPYVVSGSPSPSAGGKVTAAFIAGSGPHCSGGQCTVERYSEVALTATPNPGYGFVGWSGAACLSQQSPCRLPDISEDHTMTADFAPRYKLTGLADPAEVSILATDSNPSSSCSNATCEVTGGDTVELTVQQTANVQLREWASGPCKGTAVNPCVIPDVSSSAEIAGLGRARPTADARDGHDRALRLLRGRQRQQRGDVPQRAAADARPGGLDRLVLLRTRTRGAACLGDPGRGRRVRGKHHDRALRRRRDLRRPRRLRLEARGRTRDSDRHPRPDAGHHDRRIQEHSAPAAANRVLPSRRARRLGLRGAPVRLDRELADVTVRAGDGENGANGAKGAEGAAGGAGQAGEAGVTPGGTLEFYGFSEGGYGGAGGASPNGNRNATVVEQYEANSPTVRRGRTPPTRVQATAASGEPGTTKRGPPTTRAASTARRRGTRAARTQAHPATTPNAA